MNFKDRDQIEIVFEKILEREKGAYPYCRRVIVHLYGSDSAETCIGVARKEHNLTTDLWNVVSITGRGL